MRVTERLAREVKKAGKEGDVHAPESSAFLMFSVVPSGTRHRGTQPASATRAKMDSASLLCAEMCSRSKHKNSNPARAMTRAAVTSPRASQDPITGWPAASLRLIVLVRILGRREAIREARSCYQLLSESSFKG